jgi:cytochrome P450
MNDLSPAVQRPDHVSDVAYYDFDMFKDPALLCDPHERVRDLIRLAPPVFWTPRNGGHWIAIGHKEIYEASRDPQTFSSMLTPRALLDAMKPMLPAGTGHLPLPTPINLDPPEHTKYRAPLQAAFSPKAVLAMKEDIRAMANSLIDRVIDRGCCDFIADIAEPLPVQVFLKMLGLPVERMAEFRHLVHEFLAPIVDPVEGALRTRKVADAMKGEIEARRTEPKDDVLSLLWRSEIDGKPMTFELMEDFCVLLFIAGLDTVINGMGFGIRHLARNPDFQDELRANPKLIVESAEEMLRRYTFTAPMRRVTKDVTFSGCSMKADERVVLFLPGADLDPREFKDPERFDTNRERAGHIAFGVGAHRCLGSHLARVELQVLYQQMLERLPRFRLDETRPVKFHAGHILAMDSLPLCWH